MSGSDFWEAAMLDAYYGKTSSFGTLTSRPTVHIGLHACTLLNASASSGQPVIVTDDLMHIGAICTVGVGTAGVEAHTVQNVTGAGPYTVTLDANLANAHGAGENVAFTPADDGTDLLEPTEPSYARVQSAPADWNAAATGNPTSTDNGNPFTFPQCAEDWAAGKYIAYGLQFDAAAAGNYLMTGPAAVFKPALSGDTVVIPVGGFTTTLGGVPF